MYYACRVKAKQKTTFKATLMVNIRFSESRNETKYFLLLLTEMVQHTVSIKPNIIIVQRCELRKALKYIYCFFFTQIFRVRVPFHDVFRAKNYICYAEKTSTKRRVGYNSPSP